MTQFAPYFTLIAAIVAGSVALYIRHKKRVQSERDKFGLFIREQIPTIPERGVREFYTHTKPALKIQVSRVWHVLNEKQRFRLDRLWKEYDEIPYEDLSADNEASWMASLNQLFNEEYQHPADIIRFYYEEFYKFSA